MSRRRKERFAQLPERVLESEAVTTLSHAAFRVLVLMAKQYHGHNNGALGLTAEQAREYGIGRRQTFYRALRELEEHCLIERTYHASRVPPRPTQYAVTWRQLDDTKYTQATRTPSLAWRDWQRIP